MSDPVAATAVGPSGRALTASQVEWTAYAEQG